MQAYFGERAHFDQASAILDSTLQGDWGESNLVLRASPFNLQEKSPGNEVGESQIYLISSLFRSRAHHKNGKSPALRDNTNPQK